MYFQRDFNYWASLLLITLLIEQNFCTDSQCIAVKHAIELSFEHHRFGRECLQLSC